MLALGKYPEVSLQEARQKRDEARTLVKAGKHPTREKHAEKLRRTVEGEHIPAFTRGSCLNCFKIWLSSITSCQIYASTNAHIAIELRE
jgi:hypothetical protein